ncbi:MAG: TIGR03546 family protein [Treponemataceae bacterium]|nr:TIGR03546 family protein [Treponemataceae bacterium]
MITYIVNFLKALNSNSKPSQIANSFCIGLILGFMPKNNLLWYILLVLFAFVRINKAGYFIMMLVGALIAPAADTLFDSVGYAVLTFQPLESCFSWLLDVPFVGFTKFNNTIVCGSLACGLICYIPLYVLLYFGIKAWRKHVAPAFNNSKLLKTVYQIPVIGKISEQVAKFI